MNKLKITDKDQLKKIVSKIINNQKIIDIHTHLFPPEHSGFYKSGIIELLTYHYLTTELLSNRIVKPEIFFAQTKYVQAEIIWNELFLKKIPISEACRGIVTILSELNINFQNLNFKNLLNEFDNNLISENSIFNSLNLKKVIMTNNPIDHKEWSLFYMKDWDRKRYIASIRMDDIFSNKNNFFKNTFIEKNTNKEYDFQSQFKLFLEDITFLTKPAYFAISTDGKGLNNLIKNKFFSEIFINHLIENRIPLAIMLGVRRNVNKSFELGGDGIGDNGLEELELLATKKSNLSLLVSHLSNNYHHQITVLSRKFPNIKLFGFWWFNNQPSLIKKDLAMRFDLLGHDQILQHSDSRVMEQLIFKWKHFKEILEDELIHRYFKLIESNWIIDEIILNEDINKLLFSNPMTFLNLDL